jgi:nucleotide-binding universal stress UspA family protein
MNIMLAVDDSPYSQAAAEEVINRPWPSGSIVRILSVVEPMPPPATEFWIDTTGTTELVREQLLARADKLTLKYAELLAARNLQVEREVAEGEAAATIVSAAKDWPADIIIVGSHGYHGLKKLLLGSVAHSVVTHAPCTVEVVHHHNAA